jgi:hypothetical protein
MDFSQYVRFKILEDEYANCYKETHKATKGLDEHKDLIMRLIINGYLKLSAMADQTLSKELIEEIKQASVEQHKKLGIAKE